MMFSEMITIVIIIIATTFSVIGVVGFHRLPDVYTRLHTIGKVGVLGVVLLLIAAAVSIPVAWSKALVLILFLVVAGPVTAHVLGSAAYRLDIEMKNPLRNDLKKLEQ